MKVVCDNLNIDSGISLVKTFEALDITSKDVDEFLTPVVFTTVSDYYDHKVVGYYPNLTSQITSLILSGSDNFKRFLSEYSEFSKMDFVLLDNLELENFNGLKIDENISKLVHSISSNRNHLLDFCDSLKLNRPVELQEDFSNFEDLMSDKSKVFFIAYLSNCGFEVKGKTIANISSPISLASYNINATVKSEYPRNYEELINSYYNRVMEFGLELAYIPVIGNFSINTKYRKFDIYYDLIYALLESWGVS